MHAEHVPTSYGLLAEFSSEEALCAAAEKVRDAKYTRTDAFHPHPVHGITEALGKRKTRMNLVMLLAGITGFFIGLGMQYWVSAVTYPHIISGKPMFSWPSFIPVMFECTVLCSAVTGFIVLWTRNGLPRLHHPLFAVPAFERATTDKFFIVIKSDDKKYDAAKTRSFLQSIGSENVYEVPMDGATKID
jgi:hypothetical protein